MHTKGMVDSEVDQVELETERAHQLRSAARPTGTLGAATRAPGRLMTWVVVAVVMAALVWIVGAQAPDSGASRVRAAAAPSVGYGTTALPCRHMMRWPGPAPGCSTTTEDSSRVSPGASSYNRVDRIKRYRGAR